MGNFRIALFGLAAVIAAPAWSAPIVLGTYYEDSGETECSSTTCTLQLSAAPAGKRVTLQALDCEVLLSHVKYHYAQVVIPGRVRAAVLIPQGESASLSAYVIHYTTPLIFGDNAVGVKFTGYADGSGMSPDTVVRCTLTGTLTPK